MMDVGSSKLRQDNCKDNKKPFLPLGKSYKPRSDIYRTFSTIRRGSRGQLTNHTW